MITTRLARRLGAVLVATALVVGAGTTVATADQAHDRGQQQAQQALEKARKAAEKARRTPAVVEAKGTVAAVNVAAKTFDLNVKESNTASLRGKKVTFSLANPAFVSLNDRVATLADIKVGDSGKVTGLVDAATGRVVAYLARFSRPAPSLTQVKGTVASVNAAAGTFTVTVPGTTATATAVKLGTPSIVSLNNQPATLASILVSDKVEATGVVDATGTFVAYVAKFTRPVPVAASPQKLGGTVASVSTTGFVLITDSGVKTITLAVPALITLNDVVATLADIHVGDKATASVITNSTGGLVAYFVVVRR